MGMALAFRKTVEAMNRICMMSADWVRRMRRCAGSKEFLGHFVIRFAYAFTVFSSFSRIS